MARKLKPTEEFTTSKDILERIEATLSAIQLKVLLDIARFIVARCSRRAGKTYFDAAKLVHTGLKFGGSTCVYFGLTRDSAKEAIWEELLNLLLKLEIKHTYSENKLEIEIFNSDGDMSRIRLMGADMDRIKDRLRGRKFRIVIVDECAFFYSIDKLILAALQPTLADLKGQLIMTSSPGALPKGLFYKADQGKQDPDKPETHWSRYFWTAYDNPFFQGPADNPKYANRWEEELHMVCAMQYDGDWNDPTFQREWLGLWVFDDTTLCYPFDIEKYLIKQEYKIASSEYSCGLNISVPGKQSIVVVKSGDYNREVQVIEAFTFKSKNLDELNSTIEDVIERYDLNRVVCYIGDHPKSILDDFKARYKLPLALSRHEKIEYFQNVIATDMAAGHIRAVDEDTIPLVEEWTKIVKNDDGVEIADQETVLADAFFVAYLDVYSTTLKQVTVPESAEDTMERQLLEAAQQELNDIGDLYGYEGYGSED